MSKDVKLAFVVGGILISVLVVYVLVVPGGQKRPDKQAVTLDTIDTKSAPTTPDQTTPAPGGDKSADAKPADSKPTDRSTTDAPEADAKVADAGPTTKPTDPFAGTSEDRWMLALNRGSVPMMTSAPPAGQSSQAAGSMTSKSAKASATPPSMMAQTASAASDQGAPSTQPVSMVDSSSPHAAMRTHVVKPGESIAKIAEAVYGSQNYWPYIIRANPGIVAEKIRPGMTINLPAESDVKTPAAAPASGAPEKPDANAIKPDTTSPKLDTQTQYEVQPGDSLAKISMKLYGNSGKWQAIYDLNKEAIGENPAKLKLKSILKLPAPPTQKT
jgi:nucleoid-associated protein YgaU